MTTAFVFVGDAARVSRQIESFEKAHPELAPVPHEVIHATQSVRQEQSLISAIRGSSSMRLGLEAVAEGRADAMVSAGSTGALMALSRHIVKTLPGIDRPAIIKALDGRDGARFWLLDLGANIECSAALLHQFARMGSAVAQSIGGVARPRVALLNIGAEQSKGPAVIRQAADLLTDDAAINYVGFIEANEFFNNRADVVVADGFSGNVALKAIEGAAAMAQYLLTTRLASGLASRVAGWLIRGRMKSLRRAYDPAIYNGASLVGLRAVVVKSHGGANRLGFQQAVRQATGELEADVPLRIAGVFAS